MTQEAAVTTEDPKLVQMLRHLASKAVDLAFSKFSLISQAKEGDDLGELLKGLGEGGDKGGATAVAESPATPPAEGGAPSGAPVGQEGRLNELAEKELKRIGNPIRENDMRRKMLEFSPEGQVYFVQSYLRNLETLAKEPAFAAQAHDAAYAEAWKDFQMKYQLNPANKKWEKKSDGVTLGGKPAVAAPTSGATKASTQEAISAMAGTQMEFDGKNWIVRHASLKDGKSFKTMEEAGKFLTLLAESETVAEETTEVKPVEESSTTEEKPQEVVASSSKGGNMAGVNVQADTAQNMKGANKGALVKGIPTSGDIPGGHGKFPKASGTTVTEGPAIKTGIEAGPGKDSLKLKHEGAAQKSDAEIKRLQGQHGLMSEITKLCSTEEGMEILNEALQLVVSAKKNAIARGRANT